MKIIYSVLSHRANFLCWKASGWLATQFGIPTANCLVVGILVFPLLLKHLSDVHTHCTSVLVTARSIIDFDIAGTTTPANRSRCILSGLALLETIQPIDAPLLLSLVARPSRCERRQFCPCPSALPTDWNAHTKAPDEFSLSNWEWVRLYLPSAIPVRLANSRRQSTKWDWSLTP